MAEPNPNPGFDPMQGSMPPPMAPEKQGMFRKQQPQDLSQVYSELNSLSARLRITEERYTNVRKKMQLVEQNMLSNHKNVNVELKASESDIADLKRDITDIKNKINLMIGEFQTFAKKDEVKVIERYVNLWEPLKYVTANEVESIVRRILDAKDQKK